jgi:DNA polymerase elongation subunit (family B)
MKKKNNIWQVVNFDYASLYPSVIKYHTQSYRMLIVSMNRKKVIEQLWGTENKNMTV